MEETDTPEIILTQEKASSIQYLSSMNRDSRRTSVAQLDQLNSTQLSTTSYLSTLPYPLLRVETHCDTSTTTIHSRLLAVDPLGVVRELGTVT